MGSQKFNGSRKKSVRTVLYSLFIVCWLLSSAGCTPDNNTGYILFTATPTVAPSLTPTAIYPQRPHYQPGELVDYTAQSGDNLPMLARRFNTTIDQILKANPSIPGDVTTLPPGMPMKIPIYYMPLWGPSYQIIPDSLYVDGPAATGFDTQAFIDSHSGWLKGFSEFAFGGTRTAGEIVDYVAINYSISPKLLLALLEYQAGGLSLSSVSQVEMDYPLGYRKDSNKGLYMQLGWAANFLNNGFYGYTVGNITSLQHQDGTLERTDPWQNAGTVALQYYFNYLYDYDTYLNAVHENGLAATYRSLFGDPWQNETPVMEGSLHQPELRFPFETGQVWALTGGPHTNWGSGDPLTSLDFAPPSMKSGCGESPLWETAVADGVVVREATGVVVLDLDGDGNELTGWDIFYMHMADDGKVALGAKLKAGDPIGHPSCEGGEATGTHVHLARKYNGEWVPAAGILAFNLEGWVAFDGDEAYEGGLERDGVTVTASTVSARSSFIQADK